MDRILIIVGFACLVLSAFFSSSEAAFLSLQRTRVAHLVSTHVPGARRIAEMIERPERLLSTVLLANNLVNIAFTSLVTAMAVALLGQGMGVIVATAASTLLVLVLGEIVPKTVAVNHAERVAFLVAAPLQWTEALLLPLAFVLQKLTRAISSLFGGARGLVHSVTEAELRALIDIGEAEGTVAPVEAEMLENVFRFGDRQVREVMTPRTEMVSIEEGATLGEFLEVYAEHAHTRFPVHRETIDNIIGVLSTKDILKSLAAGGIDYNQPVTVEIREAYFVPETKRVAELFDEMRRTGHQMAIAIDEFGGVAGLVTLKRLTEEVVGPVGEEGATPEEEFEAIDENTFEVEGGMSVQEVEEELGIDLPEGDFETIAGFVLYRLGHIPTEGEQFEYDNLKFEVTQMRDLRIETIRITRQQPLMDGSPVETNTG